MVFIINKRKNIEYSIILIFFIIVFVSITYKTGLLNSGFRYFMDDHQITAMYYDLKHQGFFKAIQTWIINDRNVDRFRPYYQIQMLLLTQMFKLNSTLWFLFISLLGSLTAFSLFLFSRLLNFSVLISLIFSISTLLGWQSEIWMRPIIPDAYGMFFLSVSLVFLGLSCKPKNQQLFNDIFFVAFAVLGSLCKESYIIFIPTLIIGKIFLYQQKRQVSLLQSIKNNRFVLLSLVLTFVLEISYIVLYLGTSGTGYAGVSTSSLVIKSILSTSQVFLEHSLLYLAFIGLGLSLIVSKFNRNSILVPLKEFTPFLILLLIAGVPHIFLYSKSGIIAGFYLFPAIIIACLFLAKVLSYLSYHSKWLSFSLIAILVVILSNKVPDVWNKYSTYANDSKSMNDVIQQVELCTVNHQKALVVVNPRVHHEPTYAFHTVLKNVINFNIDNLVIATYGLEKTHFYSDTLKEAENYWIFLDPEAFLNLYQNQTILNTKDKSSIGAVVIFDNLYQDFIETNKSWFVPQQYELSVFPVSYLQVNLYCKQSY